MIIRDVLAAIYTHSKAEDINTYLPLFNRFMPEYGIENRLRIAMFLAQVGHESGELRYTEELASGKAYEFRKDLGNTEEGDGVKYKGRGLIQITGKSNYIELSETFGINFITAPELLSAPEYACESACWWWQKHGLNEISDTGDIKKATKRINGGINGLDDRLRLYNLALSVL